MSFIKLVLNSHVKVMLFWGWFVVNSKPDGRHGLAVSTLCASSDEHA